MPQALRRASDAPEFPPEPMVVPDRAGSPVHELQDMLERRLAGPPDASDAGSPPYLRMAMVFWSAIAAWGVVGLAIYAAAKLAL